MTSTRLLFVLVVAGCTHRTPEFPLRDPFVVDTDLRDVSIACRADPTPKEPHRQTCAPLEYVSPFLWDQVDNLTFARISRGLSVEVHGEAVNVNSLDEVPDSAWFTNRPRDLPHAGSAPGACKDDDLLPESDAVADGEWTVDHGKDNGSTLGFRVDVPGKGQYMLKADDTGKPDRASAASVIGAAIFEALGFNTSCEQIVVIRKGQLKLKPDLKTVDNAGVSHPFGDKELDKALASSTPMPGGRVRMQASKWLPGLALGPFRYIGTRADDPNDVIDHADRRELRGVRVLSAWLDHWDAREQNSMDVWFSANAKDKRSSPGHVVHYFLDTSDTLGGEVSVEEMSSRLGHSYTFDFVDMGRSLITFGADERPWDRARKMPGREKFGYYSSRDFDPQEWKALYPNPAFMRMTERDAAWMARLIARFSHEDLRRFVELGQWQDPGDANYLLNVLEQRQRRVLVRYLLKLSPLGEVRSLGANQICATDFARLREIVPRENFHYTVIEHAGRARGAVPVEVGEDGAVCFQARDVVRPPNLRDDDPRRLVLFEVRNGTRAGALVIHAYDLDHRGLEIVGVTRPEA